ncbi:MAG: hypothetical protein NTY67_07095 [Cyanobacteria bacterium]|nr:hypothetical protein [Cyanobacteriota bacterium]
MSISPESVPLKYRSSSDYLASLPPWRRLLARLNWHPVREIEIETERLKARKLRLRRENELLRQEASIRKQRDLQIEALFSSDASCSRRAATTDDDSTPS